MLYETEVHQQADDNAPAIATVQAEQDRAYPIILTLGPRTRILLTAREAANMARALVDAVKALNN
jgi:hypothetical protein